MVKKRRTREAEGCSAQTETQKAVVRGRTDGRRLWDGVKGAEQGLLRDGESFALLAQIEDQQGRGRCRS